MTDGGFGVYVHWPYCRAICPYCDFNVYRDRAADHVALLDAMAADIAGWRARTGPEAAASVFFGGGTPSRMKPADVARLIAAVDAAWGLADGAEISLEANPEDADAARFADLAAAGVTRLSLGVQSFDDRALAGLGRWHSGDDARRAVALARGAFDQVSVDLIYARADQTFEAWRAELAAVLDAGVDHLSLYQLTIEPGTAFAKRAARGEALTQDADRAADFYELTQTLCEAGGLPAYEVSNHARGPDARSRHNLVYWRSGRWAGVGPGAHGRRGALGGDRAAVVAPRRPDDYAAAVQSTGWGGGEAEPLSAADQLREAVMMGLRLIEGVDLDRLAGVVGAPPPQTVIADFTQDGLARREGARLALTPDGRRLADGIAGAVAEAWLEAPGSGQAVAAAGAAASKA